MTTTVSIPRREQECPEIVELEQLLGDPLDATNAFAYVASVAAEERDELPAEAVEQLEAFGFPALTVPEPFGGRLVNLEQLAALTRALARRNPTLAVKYGSSLLGANVVWLWGSDEQRSRVAAAMTDGACSAFAVSEREHGSDLRSSETHLDADFRLFGEKWPIGNATRGRFLITLARTSAGFDLLLVDKEQVRGDTLQCLPRVPTVGLRGHDLSGIAFQGVLVSEHDRLGRPGAGMAIVLKTLQITKTGIGAISLGVMDATLELLERYTADRELYGAPISALRTVAASIRGIQLDRELCEALLVVATRSLTIAPAYLSVWSAAVKAIVPPIADEALRAGADVLAARSYIRAEFAGGAFQKLQRDHAIAAIFEGTTNVNLHSIASQLPTLVDALRGDTLDPTAIDELVDATRPAPRWDPDPRALRMTSEGKDPLVASLSAALRGLVDKFEDLRVPERMQRRLVTAVDRICAEASAIAEQAAAVDWDPSALSSFSAAQRYATLLASSAYAHRALAGRPAVSVDWARGTTAVLERVVHRLEGAALRWEDPEAADTEQEEAAP